MRITRRRIRQLLLREVKQLNEEYKAGDGKNIEKVLSNIVNEKYTSPERVHANLQLLAKVLKDINQSLEDSVDRSVRFRSAYRSKEGLFGKEHYPESYED